MAVIQISSNRKKSASLGLLCLVALFSPSAHVPPPRWWQGGWRRQHVGSAAQVELLSQVAAVLMPKTPIAELFRSFPSPNGWGEEPLEPDLTAYGVLRDLDAALFVLYDESNEKREDLRGESEALLAYGPAGSYVLHISHLKSQPVKGNLLYVQVSNWVPSGKLMLSKVLTDLWIQICDGLGKVISADVLERLQLQGQTSPMIMPKDTDFIKIAATLRKIQSFGKNSTYLAEDGFSQASIDRMQKCMDLIGLSTEMRLQSRIQQLLDMGQSKCEIAEGMMTSSPSLGHNMQQLLNRTTQWLLKEGLVEEQVDMAIRTFPRILTCKTRQNWKQTVQWLLELGLTKRQVARALEAFPKIDQASTTSNFAPTVQWLLDLGFTRKQLLKTITVSPAILNCCPERDLKPKVFFLLDLGLTECQIVKAIAAWPKFISLHGVENMNATVQWLFGLGLSQPQAVKAISTCPQILTRSVEENLQPKVRWLFDLGLARHDVAQVILRFPKALSCSIEKNLQPKVQWLLQLGVQKPQLPKILVSFPALLSYSISTNLNIKLPVLQSLLGVSGLADLIARRPTVLGYSYERLSSRAKVLSELNETSKLAWTMDLPEDQFRAWVFKKFFLCGLRLGRSSLGQKKESPCD